MNNQNDYTKAVYQYMLSLGVMSKGDFVCVNQELHSDYVEQCHKIALSEEYLMLVVPDSSKEPPQLVKLPMLDTPGAAGGELVKPPVAKGKGKQSGGRKGTDRKSRPPPTTMSKVVTPAAGSQEVAATPPHEQQEEMEDDKGESVTATEPPRSDVD